MTPDVFEKIIAGTKPVLVDFYADWCEPCKWLEPVMDEVNSLVKDRAYTLKVNIDQHPELKTRYGIQGIPVLIIFKDGEPQWRMNGFTYAKDLSHRLLSYAAGS